MAIAPRKLLLIQPPVEDFYDTPFRVEPLGLAYLKSTVRQFLPEVRVRIVDFHQGWGRRTVRLPPELSALREFYRWPDRSPLRTFHEYYRFGATDAQMLEVIREERPDFVGISCLFSASHREALQVAALARESGSVRTILGGAHATAAPVALLSRPEVDFVVVGEGERPLVELLRLLVFPEDGEPAGFGSIAGLAYRVGETVRLNPPTAPFPIDLLPEPDFEDFPSDRYRYRGRAMAQLVTSRGCPYRCSFCTVHATFGAGYRVRPVEAVLEEMQRRFDRGVRVFDFEDDNLTFQRGRMTALCRAIVDRFGEELELLAMNGVSYQDLDSEVLEWMRRAGFRELNLSLVSSDRAVLDGFRRPHRVEKLTEVVEEGFRLGFRMVCYQILGLPDESVDAMIDTLALLAKLPVRLGASPFYLAPASAVAEDLSIRFDTARYMLCRLTAMGDDTSESSRRDIFTLFVLCRLLNFLKELPVEEGAEVPLEVLLDTVRAAGEGRRLLDGIEVVERLLGQGRYVALTAGGVREVTAFDSALFRRAWSRIGPLVTLSRGTVALR